MGKAKTVFAKTGTVFKKPIEKYRGLSEHKKAKHKTIVFGVAFGVLLLILAGLAFMATYYDGKAVPGTYLAGADISGQNFHEIKETAKDLMQKIRLDVTYDKTTISASATDMGLTLKTDDTAQAAIDAAKDRDVLSRYNPLGRKDTDLIVDYDGEIFQQFLNEKFAEYVTPPRETAIAYNDDSQRFEILGGESGLAISAKKLRPTLEDLIKNPRTEAITAELSGMEPTISVVAAQAACDEINQKLTLKINIVHNGQLLFYFEPAEIARWVDAEPNIANATIKVSFNKDKIRDYLVNTVAYQSAMAPVDEKILVDKDGNHLMIIQHGRRGQQIKSPESVTDIIYGALVSQQNADAAVEMVEANFKTETVVTDNNRWVEINLSSQRVFLWDGANQVASFIVSTGVAPAYATPVGEFRVYMKTSEQPMYNLPLSTCIQGGVFQLIIAGDKYCIPGVKWVSYFYQDYAFHTKYWNNIWGAQSSHGCINMHEADAKTLYDFALIGTRVVSHY